jgi:DNA-directed RNA polymerase subunit RPC12/RpoP
MLIKTHSSKVIERNKNYKCPNCGHEMSFPKPPTFVACSQCKKIFDLEELIKL